MICEHSTSEILIVAGLYEVHRCTWGCDTLFVNEFDADLPLPLVKATHPARYHGEDMILWHPPSRSAMQYTIGWGVDLQKPDKE